MEAESNLREQCPNEANLCITSEVQEAASPTIPSTSECSTPTNIHSRASPNQSEGGPMLYDPNLPPGWTRRVTQRTMGASAGKYDVYIFSPDRKKIRSKTDLILYLDRNKLDMDPNEFDFTVRGRHNMPGKKPTSQKKKKTQSKPVKPTIGAKENGGSALSVSSDTTNNLGSSTTTAAGSANSSNGANNNKPKLVVKLSFPVPRLKRTASMKSKKKKILRQKSHSSQSSSAGDLSECMETTETEQVSSSNLALTSNPSIKTTTTTNTNHNTTDLSNCDMLSESELFI